MRYLFVLIVLLFLSSNSTRLDAQVRVNVNVDAQPVWGPTGYDYVENYYFPDIEVYYNVPQHRYYYYQRGRWISSFNLPSRFRGFDLYKSYKVVLNESNPWRNHEAYRVKYSSFKGHNDQQVIRDSRDSKYYVNKNHPEHNTWLKQQKQGIPDRKVEMKGNDSRIRTRNVPEQRHENVKSSPGRSNPAESRQENERDKHESRDRK
jgi:hypothetical protein